MDSITSSEQKWRENMIRMIQASNISSGQEKRTKNNNAASTTTRSYTGAALRHLPIPDRPHAMMKAWDTFGTFLSEVQIAEHALRILLQQMPAPTDPLATPLEDFIAYHNTMTEYMGYRRCVNASVQSWERGTRETLLKEHEGDTKVNAERNQIGFVHYWVLEEEFPPEGRDVKELKRMGVDELEVFTVHKGCYVVVRTLTRPLAQGSAIKVVVENLDPKLGAQGTAENLLIHNLLSVTAISERGFLDFFLPRGSLIVIKQPHLVLHNGRSTMIMTTHPTDVVIKRQAALAQQQREAAAGKDPSEHAYNVIKDFIQQDAKLVREGKDHSAVLLLSNALREMSSSKETDLWCSLMSWRALLRVPYQVENALEDCERVLAIKPKYERLGQIKAKVLMRLGKFKECKTWINTNPECKTEGIEGPSLMWQVKQGLEEQKGQHDFVSMRKQAIKMKLPRLTHATYHGPVEGRICAEKGKGKGLFATRRIEAGELILCEKALRMDFRDQLPDQVKMLGSMPKKGVSSWLVSNTISYLLDNPSKAAEVFDFIKEGTPERLKFDEQGRPIINAFAVEKWIQTRRFQSELSCQNLLEIDKFVRKAIDDREDRNWGIWVKGSYINHACISNVIRTFIGDMMVVTAKKPIEKDEEIVTSYIFNFPGVNERTETLQKTYGFVCNCKLCIEQRSEPKDVISKRVKLEERLDKLIYKACRHRSKGDRNRIWKEARGLYKEYSLSFGEQRQIKPEYGPFSNLQFELFNALERSLIPSAELMETLEKSTDAEVKDLRKFEPEWDMPPTSFALLTKLAIALKVEGKDRAVRRAKKLFREWLGRVTALGEHATNDWDLIMERSLMWESHRGLRNVLGGSNDRWEESFLDLIARDPAFKEAMEAGFNRLMDR